MAYDFRLPRIDSNAEAEMQMQQMQSYLYAFVEQLNFAINHIEAGNVSEVSVLPTNSVSREQSAIENFNEIKALIIKSADIVTAYYDQMQTVMQGDYVAQSVFGTYRNTTQNQINANAEGIEQLYSSQQIIESNVSEVQDMQRAVSAHIRTGALYTDEQGNPVYGVEVGQKNTVDGVETFNKYARFTSNRLSFYDQNGTEVAYISDYKLYITNAEITGSITLGRYYLDTTDGLAFRWA